MLNPNQHQKTLWVTRPKNQALGLAQQLSALNVNCVIFPVMETVAITDAAGISVLQKISEHLPMYDGCIFISPAAVEFMQPWITQKPPGLLFCPGADTAKAIQQQGWGNALYPAGHYNREALLALPTLQAVQGMSILVCQSRQSPNFLQEKLSARGAKVTVAACYERRLPNQTAIPDCNAVDLILCTSAASLDNLLQLCGSGILARRLLVSSERLSAYAKQLGFQLPPLRAENAGDEAIVHVIQQWLR